MVELHGMEADVDFDWATAARLSAELRATATLLGEQIPRRNSIRRSAREEWRGRFGDEFDERILKGASQARALADAMNDAAKKLDALAEAAREEQARRERARAWAAEQESESGLEKKFEGFFGLDEPPVSLVPVNGGDVVFTADLPARD